MAKLDDLGLANQPVDDRWTLDKLRRAGWEFEWEKPCRTCGDQIQAYKRVGEPRLLILDEAVLSVHDCGRG